MSRRKIVRLSVRILRKLPLPRTAKLAIAKKCHVLFMWLRRWRRVLGRLPFIVKAKRLALKTWLPISKVLEEVSRPLAQLKWQLRLLIFAAPVATFIIVYAFTRPVYQLSQPASLLAGMPDKNVVKQISLDTKMKQYVVNQTGMKTAAKPSQQPVLQVGGSAKSAGFSATFPQDFTQGMTVYDDINNLSFTIVPDFGSAAIKNLGQHFVYPISHGTQAVYTVKDDGVKEDIILNSPSGDTANFTYTLKLPNYLQAKLEASGAVGIYSANPALFGNITYGSDADKAKVAAARVNGAKTNLVFELLPPVINDSNGKADGAATNAHAKFNLNGNTLTVSATGLANLHYPVSIDPSVLVNSSFGTGNNEGGVSVASGSITENGITGGSVSGGWNYTYNSGSSGTYSGGFTNAREGASVVAYNGYLYMMGGHTSSSTPGSVSWSTAGTYNWTVPTGVSSINVTMYGAIGGNGINNGDSGGTGGAGGKVTGTLSVTAGTTLTMIIGGNGGNASCATGSTCGGAAGYNGGYVGGYSTSTTNGFSAGGSGGCTDLKNGSTYLAVAPGGGGGGGPGSATGTNGHAGGNGGAGGGTTGSAGAHGAGGTTYGTGGGGGTNTGGGSGGNSGGNGSHLPGINTGGSGSGGGGGGAGGSGGCGYYGGGGGGEAGNDGVHSGGGGGGGGAALVPSGGTTTAGGSTGHGSATITYTSSSATWFGDVQYAPINSNGTIGTWASAGSMIDSRQYGDVVAYNGYLYMLGGNDGTTYLNEVEYTKVNSDGSLGGWQQTSSFITGRYHMGAVASNGYLYVMGGDSGVATSDCSLHGSYDLCDGVQFAPINADGSVGTWQYTANSAATSTFSAGFTTPRGYFQATTYNGKIYIGGGYSGSGGLNDIQYATINSNGTVGSWTTTTSFTTVRWSFIMTVYNGYLYIGSGYNGSTNLNDVQYAAIYSNGDVGPWTATVSTLGSIRNGDAMTSYNGYLYMLAGTTSNSAADCTSGSNPYYCSGVQYAKIDSAGVISAWANNANSLGTAVRQACVTTYNNYIYVLGGYSDSLGASQALVQYAALNSDGSTGTWSTTTAFSVGRHALGCAVYNGYMYVIGGTEYPTSSTACKNTGVASQLCNDVQYASISSNGTVGTWTTTAYFTNPRRNLGTVEYNGYLYLIGGWDAGSNYYSDTQYGSLNSNGSIAIWQSTSSFNTARFGMGAYAYAGYIYIVGGRTATSAADCTTGTNPYYCTGVQYAAVNTNGTLGTWQFTYNSGSSGTYSGGMSTSDNLFAGGIINGYLYVNGGSNNTGNIATSQYAPINSDGTVGTWSTTASQTTATAEQPNNSTIINGVIYTVGGDQGSTAITTITYSHINNGGAGVVGTGGNTTSLPQVLNGGTAVAYNGYFYFLGGHTASAGDSNVVYYAPFSSTGTVGTWNTTTNLPQVLDSSATVTYNGYIYEIGGLNGGTNQSQSTVYYAVINSNGTLGTWQTSSNSLPVALDSATAVEYNGYIYEMGGESNSTLKGTVYYAPIGSAGAVGAWTTTTSLPTPTYVASSVVYNGYIYEIGGWTGSVVSKVYYSKINASGTIGAWNATTSLRSTIYYGMAVAYNGYLYSMGGTNGAGTMQAMQEYAPINANGTIGEWQSTTPLSNGWATAGAITYGGYRCLLGGNYNGGYTSLVNCVPLYSNPRVGMYSTQLDMTYTNGLDVTPASLVVQGTNTGNPGNGETGTEGNGGIITDYAFADDSCTALNTYEGSGSAMGTNNYLGYSSNGCGIATNQARYVWVHLTVDDSLTATYPDSSGNHTSVTGLLLYYHANSGGRLRGGATFMNQQLQALDSQPGQVGLPSSTTTLNLTSGLVADYNFNGNANDASGNGYNGTVNGATLTADRLGTINSAYAFTGAATSNITATTYSTLSTGYITVAAWVDCTASTGTRETILSAGESSSTGTVFAADDGTGQITFWIHNANGWPAVQTPTTYGSWHFIVGTFNGSILTLYVDGSLAATADSVGNMNTPTSGTSIGSRNSNDVHWFNGSIDDVRVWNRALNYTEVQALYNQYR